MICILWLAAGAVNPLVGQATHGSNDASFNTVDVEYGAGEGFNNVIQDIVLQSDGKIVVGGFFTSSNGIPRNRVARLNADGSLDTTFDPGSGFNSGVRTLYLQDDGKVLVAGGFTSFNGTSRNSIARLNSDGTLDTSFDPGSGFDGVVYALTVQSNGKVLVGGFFTSYNGTSRHYITRLNADGSLDTSFELGTGFDFVVSALALQDDGKVLVAGGFTSYNGTTRNRIARLNSNGTLDTSFDPGTGFSGSGSNVVALVLQSDGRILAGGHFFSFNGTSRNRIVRLNADGTLDSSFDPGTGFNSTVSSLGIQTDGKVFSGGHFTSFNGTTRNRIARLNTDGSLDATFNIGTGFDNYVSSLAVQVDGKILAAGNFLSYNGIPRSRIARLYGEYTCPPVPTAAAQIFCSTGNKTVADLVASGTDLRWYDTSTGGTPLASTEILATGTYYVSQTVDGCESDRIGVSVTVHPLPTATLSGGGTVCPGGSAELYITVTGTGPWTIAIDNGGEIAPLLGIEESQLVDGVFTWGVLPNTYEIVYVQDANCSVYTSGGSVTVSLYTQPELISFAGMPTDPLPVNSIVSASASFTEDNLESAIWDWGDGTTTTGDISGSDVTGSHTYSATGVYTVGLTITDVCGNETNSTYDYVVVYDPSGGFATGHGFINSPPGAYAPDPALVGNARFGFMSKYQKGATVPTGNTSFKFQVADLNFSSTSYDWLVISGTTARYKGEGTINGSGWYGFMLSATDGQVNGDDPDLLRFKVWDKNNDDAIVYDNQMGDADDAYATMAIGGGSIVVHGAKQAKASSKAVALDTEPLKSSFYSYPTTFTDRTTIAFTLDREEDYTLEVFNIKGALVRKPIEGTAEANKLHEFVLRSDGLTDGIYIVKLITTTQLKSLKLILER